MVNSNNLATRLEKLSEDLRRSNEAFDSTCGLSRALKASRYNPDRKRYNLQPAVRAALNPPCGPNIPRLPGLYHPLFAKNATRRGGIRTDAGPGPRAGHAGESGFWVKSPVDVEKVSRWRRFSCVLSSALGRFVLWRAGPLIGRGQHHARTLTQEADQSLEVLRRRRQKELLTHELQSAQAQAAQSDLILEFREQGLHLLSLPLCVREFWCVGQLASALPSRLIHVDGQKPECSAGALRL